MNSPSSLSELLKENKKQSKINLKESTTMNRNNSTHNLYYLQDPGGSVSQSIYNPTVLNNNFNNNKFFARSRSSNNALLGPGPGPIMDNNNVGLDDLQSEKNIYRSHSSYDLSSLHHYQPPRSQPRPINVNIQTNNINPLNSNIPIPKSKTPQNKSNDFNNLNYWPPRKSMGVAVGASINNINNGSAIVNPFPLESGPDSGPAPKPKANTGPSHEVLAHRLLFENESNNVKCDSEEINLFENMSCSPPTIFSTVGIQQDQLDQNRNHIQALSRSDVTVKVSESKEIIALSHQLVNTNNDGSLTDNNSPPVPAPLKIPVLIAEEYELVGSVGVESTCETYLVKSAKTGQVEVFKPAAGEAYKEKNKQHDKKNEQKLLPSNHHNKPESEENQTALTISPSFRNRRGSDSSRSALGSKNKLSVLEKSFTPLKHGVVYGDASLKEMAAYILDHERFAGVPKTRVANIFFKHISLPNKPSLRRLTDRDSMEIQPLHSSIDHNNSNSNHKIASSNVKAGSNPGFNLNDSESSASSVFGSLQEYMSNQGSAEDFGSGTFDPDQVHAIGCLDIRMLNLDRHLANILVSKDSEGHANLIPIDHGYTLPSYTNLKDVRLEWASFKQCSLPFSVKTQKYIADLDPLSDAARLQKVGIREESIISMLFSSLLLIRAAAEGFTLAIIADLVQRKHNEDDDYDFDDMDYDENASDKSNSEDEEDPTRFSCLERIVNRVLSLIKSQRTSLFTHLNNPNGSNSSNDNLPNSDHSKTSDPSDRDRIVLVSSPQFIPIISPSNSVNSDSQTHNPLSSSTLEKSESDNDPPNFDLDLNDNSNPENFYSHHPGLIHSSSLAVPVPQKSFNLSMHKFSHGYTLGQHDREPRSISTSSNGGGCIIEEYHSPSSLNSSSQVNNGIANPLFSPPSNNSSRSSPLHTPPPPSSHYDNFQSVPSTSVSGLSSHALTCNPSNTLTELSHSNSSTSQTLENNGKTPNSNNSNCSSKASALSDSPLPVLPINQMNTVNELSRLSENSKLDIGPLELSGISKPLSSMGPISNLSNISSSDNRDNSFPLPLSLLMSDPKLLENILTLTVKVIDEELAQVALTNAEKLTSTTNSNKNTLVALTEELSHKSRLRCTSNQFARHVIQTHLATNLL